MVRFTDLCGQVFGSWTVIKRVYPNKNNDSAWECSCACGRVRVIARGSLVKGRSKSCGCSSVRPAKHGMHNTPEYFAWQQLKKRCLNEQDKDYPEYGGRGIRVCNEWVSSFQSFFADMGPRPSSIHSIDRIDVDGDYEPSNCRWATAKQQMNNRRLLPGNKTGISGVFFVKADSLWRATFQSKYLGSSPDFFEACCLRKSAEVRYAEVCNAN